MEAPVFRSTLNSNRPRSLREKSRNLAKKIKLTWRILEKKKKDYQEALLGENQINSSDVAVDVDKKYQMSQLEIEERKNVLLELNKFLVKHVITSSLNTKSLYSLEKVFDQIKNIVGTKKIISYVTAPPEMVKMISKSLDESGLMLEKRENHKY